MARVDAAPIEVIRGVLPVGRSGFGPVTPEPGVNVIQVALDRGDLALKSEPLDWALELSLDAGATWTTWGGATTVAGNLLTDIGLAAESSLTVSLPAPADRNTRLRGHVTTKEPLTTTVTLRSAADERAAALLLGRGHSSVSIADISVATVQGASVISLTTPAMTITSNPNRVALIGFSQDNTNSTGHAGSVGGVAGSVVAGTDNSSVNNPRGLMIGVTAPPSGSQTATVSWTTVSTSAICGAVATSGADQATSFDNGTTAEGSGGTPTLSITSRDGDLTCDLVASRIVTAPTAGQTSRWTQADAPGFHAGGGSTGPGTGTTIHTWSGTAFFWKMSGCNIRAAPVVSDKYVARMADSRYNTLLRM